MSNTNRAVKPQNIGLKFRIQDTERISYKYSKIKGPDQLCCYCAADLRLYFCKCKKNRFSHDAAHFNYTTSCVTKGLPQGETQPEKLGTVLKFWI